MTSLAVGSPRIATLLLRAANVLEDRRGRRELSALSDADLKDIGLSRGDIERAYGRRWWQPFDWSELDPARGGRRAP